MNAIKYNWVLHDGTPTLNIARPDGPDCELVSMMITQNFLIKLQKKSPSRKRERLIGYLQSHINGLQNGVVKRITEENQAEEKT